MESHPSAHTLARLQQLHRELRTLDARRLGFLDGSVGELHAEELGTYPGVDDHAWPLRNHGRRGGRAYSDVSCTNDIPGFGVRGRGLELIQGYNIALFGLDRLAGVHINRCLGRFGLYWDHHRRLRGVRDSQPVVTAPNKHAAAHDPQDNQEQPTTAWDRAAVVGIAAGAAARLLVLIVHPPLNFVYSDMAGYVVGAQHLATGGPQGRLDAFFPSGMHVLLAIPLLVFGPGASGLWAASVLWFFLGSLTPWLAWRWTRRVLSVPAAALTAIACSLWPLFVTQVGFFVSELPAITLLLGGLLVASRIRDPRRRVRWWELLLLGGLVGFGFTVRPQLALNDALAVVPVLWVVRRQLVPLAALAVGLVLPIGLVSAINTDAAGTPTLVSENAGVNFFLAQCDAGRVVVFGPHSTYEIESPVYAQTHRGRSYAFEGHDIWDQAFFFDQALHCIKANGPSQVNVIGRHVLDLTVTSVPWPQSGDPGMSGVARVTNIFYSVLLPTVIVASLIVFPRRDPESRGVHLVLAHLLCVLPTVVLFVSEPRYREPYDVFGLALLAALIARGLRGDLPRGRKPASPTRASIA